MRWLWLVSLLWGLSFGLIKVSFAGIEPQLLGSLRLLLALAVFGPLLASWRLLRHGRLLLLGAVQYGGMYGALFSSFPYLAGFQVAVLTITTPLLVVGIAQLWDRQWRLSTWGAGALALLGAGWIVYTPQSGAVPWLGIGLVQLSNACFAWGQVAYARWRPRWPETPDARLYAVPYLGGAALLAVTTTLAGGWSDVATLAAAQWGALAYLGVIASGLCFFLWNYGAARVDHARLAVMNNMKIPAAVVCSALLFGETVPWDRLLIGGLLMALSLMWAARLGQNP
jgi:drug/metabolite transporter (DMT)-like permease